MIGAILGDIIGSPYEFDMGDKTKDFPLFSEESYFTDDEIQKRSRGKTPNQSNAVALPID